MSLILSVALAYLAGSIPTGYLTAHLYKNIDIREFGSGNTGAANVFRVLGPWPGITTLVLDILKGLIPVLIVRALLPGHEITHILTGFATIAGHNWSIFMNFTGGKGVATSAGVFFALLPGPAFISFTVFCLVLLSSQYVSLASISASVILLLATLVLKKPLTLVLFSLVIAVLIIYKHIPNIKRLREGKENKFDFKKNFLNKVLGKG